MNTEIVVVGEDATRGEVVDYIRFHEISPDQLDNVVLINRDAVLAGTVPVARLVLAGSRAAHVRACHFEPLLSVKPDADDNEVFELFDKYNLRSLTVVNERSARSARSPWTTWSAACAQRCRRESRERLNVLLVGTQTAPAIEARGFSLAK